MKKRNRFILIFFTVVIILALFITWQIFGPTINVPQGNFFYIRTGSDYQNVKDGLVKKNIVNSIIFFERVAKFLNYNQLVKPGKYRISEGMSVFNLIRMLRSGRQSPVNLLITKLRTNQ